MDDADAGLDYYNHDLTDTDTNYSEREVDWREAGEPVRYSQLSRSSGVGGAGHYLGLNPLFGYESNVDRPLHMTRFGASLSQLDSSCAASQESYEI